LSAGDEPASEVNNMNPNRRKFLVSLSALAGAPVAARDKAATSALRWGIKGVSDDFSAPLALILKLLWQSSLL
jgi:hypothetical protein